MTNGEKFKTPKERVAAFLAYCTGKKECNRTRKHCPKILCIYEWLELEAEDESPLPCPCCGKACVVTEVFGRSYAVSCSNPRCTYLSGCARKKTKVIATHNRICKAVAAQLNPAQIRVGDTVAYRSCDDDQPEWIAFTVRLIDDGYLYENENKVGYNIAVECAHKVSVHN